MIKYLFRPSFNYIDILVVTLMISTFNVGLYWATAFIYISGVIISAWFGMKYWMKPEQL